MKNDTQLPDIVKDASKQVQNDYIKYIQLHEAIEAHPDRLQYIENQSGESVAIDCASPPTTIERLIIKYKLTEKDQRRVKNVAERIRKLLNEKQSFRLKYQNQLRRENNQTIAETLTPKIIELLADWNNPREVTHILKKKEGLAITYTEVKKIYDRNRKKIEVTRNDKALELVSGSIGSETGRLKVLSDMHQYYYERWENDRKQSDANMILKIQDTAKSELKTNEIKLTINGKIDIKASIEAGLTLERIRGKFAVHSFIAQMSAFQLNKNPITIQNMLANSYYSKYNGFKGSPPIKQEKQENHLSQLTRGYDWDKIRQMNKDIQEAEIIEETKFKEQTIESTTDTDTLKRGAILKNKLDKLLRKLDTDKD